MVLNLVFQLVMCLLLSWFSGQVNSHGNKENSNEAKLMKQDEDMELDAEGAGRCGEWGWWVCLRACLCA